MTGAADRPLPEDMLDALPAMIGYVDAQERYRFVNTAYERWFGQSRAALQDRPMAEVLGPDAYPEIRPFVRRALAGEEVAFDRVSRRHGPARRMEIRYVPDRAGAGPVRGFFVLVLDRSGRDAEERRFAEMLDGMADGFCAFDEEWRFTYCNDAAERHGGMARGAAIGRVYWELVPAALGTPIETALRRAMRDRVAVEIETASAVRQGTVALRAFPIRGGIGVSFADVTGRRAAEEAERKREAQFEAALDAAAMAPWDMDHRTGRFVASPRLNGLYAYPPDQELTLDKVRARYHPDDVGLVAARAQEALGLGGDRLEMEFRIVLPDGRVRWLLGRGRYLRGEGGQVTRSVGVIMDTTARKEAERALAHSEERLRLALTAARLGDWSWDPRTDRVELSDRAAEILGVPAGPQVTWSGILGRLHPDDRDRARRAVVEAMAGGGDYAAEYRIRRPGGDIAWVAASGRPVYAPTDEPAGMFGLVRDATAERRAEERLLVLVNELNHRVKNTLAAVQSIARRTLKDAATTSDASARLESRLMALSRAHDVLTREDWRGAELGEIVAEAVAPFEGQAGGRFSVGGPRLRLSPRAALTLSMVLQELATNAVKHGALSVAGGHVTLGWTVSNEGALDLEWREAGGPGPPAAPTRRGFGSQLIERSVTDELGGRLRMEFRPAGLVCAIHAPLDAAANEAGTPTPEARGPAD